MSFATASPTRGARESSWNRLGRQGAGRDPTRRSLCRPCRILVGSVPKSARHGGHLSAAPSASGLTLFSDCRFTGRHTPPELPWHALCAVCRLARACSLAAGRWAPVSRSRTRYTCHDRNDEKRRNESSSRHEETSVLFEGTIKASLAKATTRADPCART